MIQDIKLEIIYNAKFSVICPKCSSRIELNQAAFSAAISRCVVFECPDCKNEFYFELHSLTRAAELPLEPTAPIQAACDENHDAWSKLYNYCPN